MQWTGECVGGLHLTVCHIHSSTSVEYQRHSADVVSLKKVVLCVCVGGEGCMCVLLMSPAGGETTQ